MRARSAMGGSVSAITRDAIVDAAIAIADEDGLECISMRAVARRLGIQAMSLYHHVRDKTEMLDAVHERIFLETDLAVRSQEWAEVFRDAGRAYRAMALRHPSLFVLIATRPLATPSELAHVAPMLKVLDDAGLSAHQQLFFVQAFFCALNGFLLAEVSSIPGHPEVENSRLATPTDAAPSMLRLAAQIDASGQSQEYLSEHFEKFMDVLLAGLDERVA